MFIVWNPREFFRLQFTPLPSKQSRLADVSLTSVQRQFNVALTLDWRGTDICRPRLFTGWYWNSVTYVYIPQGSGFVWSSGPDWTCPLYSCPPGRYGPHPWLPTPPWQGDLVREGNQYIWLDVQIESTWVPLQSASTSSYPTNNHSTVISLNQPPTRKDITPLVTSLAKGGYVFGSVGLSVCLQTTLLKTLWMDWDEILWRSPRQYNEELIKFWLSFRTSEVSTWTKNTIIAVVWPDHDAGNDPEPLGLAFHHQGSTFLQWAIWEKRSTSAKEVCTLRVLLVIYDAISIELFILSVLSFPQNSCKGHHKLNTLSTQNF